MYEDLSKTIESELAQQDVVVVAISGHGGSGKSTLVDKLAQEFGVAENQVVRVDGSHAKNHLQAKGLFELFCWPAIMDLLKHVHARDRLRHTRRDDKEVESVVDVARPPLVIFEGIRPIRPEMLPFVDESIWIDCPNRCCNSTRKEAKSGAG